MKLDYSFIPLDELVQAAARSTTTNQHDFGRFSLETLSPRCGEVGSVEENDGGLHLCADNE